MDNNLIFRGLYGLLFLPAIVPHPIRYAGVLIALGGCLYIALALIVMLAYCILRIRREERMMLDTFSDSLSDFMQRGIKPH